MSLLTAVTQLKSVFNLLQLKSVQGGRKTSEQLLTKIISTFHTVFTHLFMSSVHGRPWDAFMVLNVELKHLCG